MPVIKTGILYLNYYKKQDVFSGIPYSISITKAQYAYNIHTTLRGFTPSPKTKDAFLKGKINWEQYIDLYLQETVSTEMFKSDFMKVKSLLSSGQDVTLFCHCNSFYCHRFLVGDLFLLAGYKVKYMSLDSDFSWLPYNKPLFLVKNS